jgi:predicted transcriptional regulator
MIENNKLQIELTADVVSAYVSNNPVPVGELSKLIADVYTMAPLPQRLLNHRRRRCRSRSR